MSVHYVSVIMNIKMKSKASVVSPVHVILLSTSVETVHWQLIVQTHRVEYPPVQCIEKHVKEDEYEYTIKEPCCDTTSSVNLPSEPGVSVSAHAEMRKSDMYLLWEVIG